jgi:hypothetical protein
MHLWTCGDVVLDDIFVSDVIYMCYVSAGCDICHIYVCLSTWKAKKTLKVTSLPRGAVDKGPFAECS